MAGSKQLIAQFNPDTYSLNLELDKNNKTIKGNLKISGHRRSKPSYRITLNQNNLKVSKVKLFKVDKGQKTELKISRLVHHNKLQELRIHTTNQLLSGEYEVELDYQGKISTKGTSGVYTSHWVDENNSPSEIIATQFQPHYARELMPCIDEPQAKAVFNLNLTLEGTTKEETALFNTKASSQDSSSTNSREIKFKPTPVMSTYLLALVVGHLEKEFIASKNGTQISVYSTPDKVKDTQFALSFAKQCLDLLEEKFKTPYPLEKVDLVAVPDFDAGGMENWGLITFREDLLLFDEETSTLADKQAIALVIAHEIAHQWFGNLVTMKWWDELWLNEGFASFMENYVVDSIFPEWKMFESYLVNEKSYAIRLDSLPSSRAIIKKVTSPHHANEIFDGITYEKSGSVVRMIFNLMGEESFMLGLKDYFTKYAYKSATSSDLVSCWQKHTKLNLGQFMDSWLNKPGLPMVRMSLGLNQKQIILEQSRFLSQKGPRQSLIAVQKGALKAKPNIKAKQRQFYNNLISNKYNKVDNPIWHIPIDLVYKESINTEGAGSGADFVMTKQKHVIQLPSDRELPIKLNKDGSSFYLASYSMEFLAGISKAISNNKIDNLDTLNLLTDIISLNRSQQFEPGAGAILDIMKSGSHITNPHFWASVGAFVGYLHYHLKQISSTEILNQYISDLIADNLKQLGLSSSPKDSAETTMARFEILSLAALAKDKECSQHLTNLFDSSLNDGIDSIEPEKRLLSLYSVAKRGSKADYERLFKMYKSNLNDPSLRDDLAYALCLFEDESLISKNLEIMQDTEMVRAQDILSWLMQLVGASQAGTMLTLEWIIKKDGWLWLSDNLSPHDISSAVKVMLSTAFTSKDLNRLKRFFESMNNIELEKALQESQGIAKSRILWHQKELPRVVYYLS